MQTILLKKFGTVLVSRPAGLESFNAIRSSLRPNEDIQIDFGNVLTVTPSWLDEFLSQLADYMQADITLLPTQNASVLATLPVLGSTRADRLAGIIKRALKQMEESKERGGEGK